MTVTEKSLQIRSECLKWLIRPLVRYCVRKGFTFQDYSRLSKELFVETAEKELREREEKVNISRVSAITGIGRNEVTRISITNEPLKTPSESIADRVLVQWEQDKRYLNKAGKPRVLSYEGEGSEFYRLVYTVNKHINPGTILFELLRIGAVEKTANGLKRLSIAKGFTEDVLRGYQMISRDAEHLMQSIEENIRHADSESNLHLASYFDNIVKSSIPEIRKWLIREGKLFHRRARDYISGFDRDINPDLEGEGGGYVYLNAFSLTKEEVSARFPSSNQYES